MSSTKITLLAFAFVGVVAACAPKTEEIVYVDQPGVSVEPTFTGKYK